MLFNSFEFLILFLPAVLLISSRLKGQALLAWITIASFIFYGFAGHAWFLIPIFITTVLDFFLAKKIHQARSSHAKNSLLVLSLCGNLGMLFYFKYSGFFLRTCHQLFGVSGHWLSLFDVILPAGISFYTFQTLSYIIDVYRGNAEPEESFWKFAGFVSFFPHLVAGPLTRHNQLMPALEKISQEGIKPRWEEGIFLFTIGLSKKVLIADRIANFIDPLINNIGSEGLLTSWLALLGYTLQIYFDFSGYSDMAIGLARLFGIELPKNFNQPYRALNPSDYWNRWHITLSLWLRDYVYTPIFSKLMKSGHEKQKSKNWGRIITMFVGGLWHGANWTFAVWGLYHGFFLMIFHRYRDTWSKWPVWFQRSLTFFFVCLSWVFFRAPGFAQAWQWFAGLAGRHGISAGFYGFEGRWSLIALLAVGFGVIHCAPTASHFERFKVLPRLAHCALGLLGVAALLLMNYSSRFLYFQF